MAKEGPTRLRQKVGAYARALQQYSEAARQLLPMFPYVLWVCPDQERAARIQKIVNERTEERERNIFRITTFDEYPQYFSPPSAGEGV